VDGADFLAWQRGLGKAGPSLSDGDANGNGQVNGSDLAIWQQQFESRVALPIPEPASWALVVGLAAMLIQLADKRCALQ
jgi:hypothetical protein